MRRAHRLGIARWNRGPCEWLLQSFTVEATILTIRSKNLRGNDTGDTFGQRVHGFPGRLRRSASPRSRRAFSCCPRAHGLSMTHAATRKSTSSSLTPDFAHTCTTSVAFHLFQGTKITSFESVVPGGGVEPPKGRSPADFEFSPFSLQFTEVIAFPYRYADIVVRF